MYVSQSKSLIKGQEEWDNCDANAREYGGEKTRCFLICLLITSDCTLKTVCLSKLQTLQNAGSVHGGAHPHIYFVHRFGADGCSLLRAT